MMSSPWAVALFVVAAAFSLGAGAVLVVRLERLGVRLGWSEALLGLVSLAEGRQFDPAPDHQFRADLVLLLAPRTTGCFCVGNRRMTMTARASPLYGFSSRGQNGLPD
jgi:hypothetical protein